MSAAQPAGMTWVPGGSSALARNSDAVWPNAIRGRNISPYCVLDSLAPTPPVTSTPGSSPAGSTAQLWLASVTQVVRLRPIWPNRQSAGQRHSYAVEVINSLCDCEVVVGLMRALRGYASLGCAESSV